MFIKVTYFGKNRPTIINVDKMETMYQKIDRNSNRISTCIQFSKDNYILVDETPQEIMQLIEGAKNNAPIGNIETQSFDELMETSYQGQQQYIHQDFQRPQQRRRNYNTPRNSYYNDMF
jgi:hypothetical protein